MPESDSVKEPFLRVSAGNSAAQSSEGDALVQVNVYDKTFAVDSRPHTVFSDLSFSIEQGHFVTLLGPSGCGKTTLLRLIAGLDRDFSGRVSVFGDPVDGPDRSRGIVFQESRLLPWYSVRKNVMYALPKATPSKQADQRVTSALEAVGLSDFASAWPKQLSGGMRRRVALARALVNLPNLLLLDEPFSALDSLTKYKLQDELLRVHRQNDLTSILVTHDVDEAAFLSDSVILLPPNTSGQLKIVALDDSRHRDRMSEHHTSLRSELLDLVLNH